MSWTVIQHDAFEEEFDAFSQDVQIELLAAQEALSQGGPGLGRPLVDTLNGSKHANMKELRFKADAGAWRAAFAFDPRRRAIVLCAGDKSGGSSDRFYRSLIAKADKRFDVWLEREEEKS